MWWGVKGSDSLKPFWNSYDKWNTFTYFGPLSYKKKTNNLIENKNYLNTLWCGDCTGSVFVVVGGTNLKGGYGATDGPGKDTSTVEFLNDRFIK